MRRVLSRWLSALALLALSACGGGGGDAGAPVLGTSKPAAAVVAADVVLVLSAANVANNGTETVTATATAIDANRNAMAGIPVTISVNGNAIATPKETTTNAQGEVTAGIGIGADRSLRTITVTATSGSIARTANLIVRDTGGSSTVASDLILSLSSGTIADSGAQIVTATATALDGKRNVLQGVDVSLSVDANAVLAPSGSSTNASGSVTGTVGIGNDRSNRAITVTARSGELVRTAQLQVTALAGTGTPAASDLSLVLGASRLTNGGSATIAATVTAVDVNRNALTGIPVTFRVDSSAVLVVPSNATNAQGQLTANVGIGADRSNRVVTVTATSGALTRSASFVVEGAELRAALSPRVNSGSVGNQVEYTLVDTNALPMVGQTISVTAPGLPAASGTTDANGKYVYTYTAPSSSVTFTASAAGASRVSTVEVGSGAIDAAASVPQSATVTPSPSVVSVNAAGSSSNQVELRALFYGANNQPIPRVRVRFDLDGNANSSDGTIAWLGGTYAYSDSSGVARATFTPGLRASPTNGVSVRICYDVSDFDVNAACPADRQTRATLTVAQEALSVNIRTNELVKEGAAKLTYIKEFVVMVVDSAGQAKPDVLITPSVDLPAYYKGWFSWNGLRWQEDPNSGLATSENYRWDSASRAWVQGVPGNQPSCPQEDVNRNGVREAASFFPGAIRPGLAAREEDLNWNGELDARKADVAIKMVGSAKTDANGLAIVQIEYGKDLAYWVDFVITVTASGISGTEARARYFGNRYGLGSLPFIGDALSDENIAPAFAVSPYGRSALCTDAN